MKIISAKTFRPLNLLTLIACLGVLPLLTGLAGCSTDGGHAATDGQKMDDRYTSSLVTSALAADTEYKFDSVTVQTMTGTVQLSGFVVSSDQKARAGDIAGKVQGVKSVQNNITIKG